MKELDFDVSLNWINKDLHAKVQLKCGSLNANFEYAFYLYLNGVRKSTAWYADSNVVTFKMAEMGFIASRLL